MSVMDSIEEQYEDKIAALREELRMANLRQAEEIEKLQINANRYEKMRIMTPMQFTQVWRHNLDGANGEWKTFDELIDALTKTEVKADD